MGQLSPPASRVTALNLVGDLLRKVGVSFCLNFILFILFINGSNKVKFSLSMGKYKNSIQKIAQTWFFKISLKIKILIKLYVINNVCRKFRQIWPKIY